MISRERLKFGPVEPLVNVKRIEMSRKDFMQPVGSSIDAILSIEDMDSRIDLLVARLADLERKITALENLRAYNSAQSRTSRHETTIEISDGEIYASNLDESFKDKQRARLKIIQRARLERRIV